MRQRAGTLPPKRAGGWRVRIPLGCKVPGCTGRHEALGYCGRHYARLTKAGSLDDPRRTLPDEDRLWAHTERAQDGSGCLLWTLTIMKSGYPQVWWEGKTEGAHRIAYQIAVGPIPVDYQVDHAWEKGCRYLHCIEPTHLVAVTHAENQRRKIYTDAQRARLGEAGLKGAESRWRGQGTPEERFWARGERAADDSGCLLWTGGINKMTGYGQVRWEGKTCLAHRVACALAHGPIPVGYDVDHVRSRGCLHKHCIEPAHLEAVPMLLNRGARAHPPKPAPELPPEDLRVPGRRRAGSARVGVTKASSSMVATWQARYAAGESQAALGREYGVSQATISRAIRGTR